MEYTNRTYVETSTMLPGYDTGRGDSFTAYSCYYRSGPSGAWRVLTLEEARDLFGLPPELLAGFPAPSPKKKHRADWSVDGF